MHLWEVGVVVIEAGVIAGYVAAWAMRKSRRVGGRLDAEVDDVIDAGLDRLHEVVVAKLGRHPLLEELDEEAAAEGGQVSELTRQQLELALTAAALRDEAFGHAVTEMLARVREAEQASGRSAAAGAGSVVFIGDVDVHAEGGGIGVGQVAGDVNLDRGRAGPSGPGRPGH